MEGIDSTNIKLWNEVSSIFEIDFVPWDLPYYGGMHEGYKATIKYPRYNVSPSLLSHELLHLKLTINNIFFTAFIFKVCEHDIDLSKIFNLETSSIFGNLMDHVIMYNEFISMGYKENEFVYDYGDNKFTNDDNERISNLLYKDKVYNSDNIGFYITKIIALMALKESNSDYGHAFDRLRNVNCDLFEIVSLLMKETIEMSNINNYEIISKKYLKILEDFLNRMKEWTDKNLVI